MTNKELIEILKKYPNHKIILSSDVEGNNYSPLNEWSVGKYFPECSYSGEFACLENIKEEPEEYEGWENGEDVIVLIPIN